jgi:subtilisin family serine protease
VRHRLLARAAAVGGLVAATVLVPFATSASAYTATGSIVHAAPIGNGTTDLEFALKCPAMPLTQGVNGYVFDLPSTVATAGTVVGLTGSDAQNLYDISAYVYKSDCTYSRVENGPAKDLYVTLAAGDKYLSVFTTNGANVSVTLTAPATPPAGSGPNDPLYNQAGPDNLFTAGQWNMRKVRAEQAWQVATGSGITVADLDTGLDLGHPDFACTGKVTIVPGADPAGGTSSPDDDNGHGTHTAGIIGACTNNGVGVAGIAPDATLMPIKVLSAAGGGTADTLATAIRTATDQGAHVINMSLGFGIHDPLVGLTIPYTGTADGLAGLLAQITSAVSYATSHGVVVVAAAGNESASLCGYPAFAAKVVCVGSSDPRDLNSYFGNFPVKVDGGALGAGLLAPGGTGTPFCDLSSQEIISTYDRAVDAAAGDCDTLPGYSSLAGTSMATPLVSGAAALVYGKLGGVRSTANAAKVIEALTKGSVDLYTPGYDPMSGYGRLDALKAVTYWP